MTMRQSTIQKLDAGLEAMVTAGLPVNASALARYAGVTKRTSTQFLLLPHIKRHSTSCTSNGIYSARSCVSLRAETLRCVPLRVITKVVGFNLFDVVSFLMSSVARLEGELPDITRVDQMINFGKHFAELYIRVVSSEKKDTGISSRNFYPLRNLMAENSFSRWFIKHGGYEIGVISNKFSVSERGHATWRVALTKFTQLDFPVCTDSHNFSVDLNELPSIKPADVKKILNEAVGIAGHKILLNDNARPSEADTLGLTRMYGLGTAISSETRLKMGLIGYDVTACFQVIARARCLASIDSPEHDKFIADPKAYRRAIANESGISYAETKIQITAITFGGSNRLDSLEVYAKEEKQIRESVISMAMLADDGRYDDACDLAAKAIQKNDKAEVLAIKEGRKFFKKKGPGTTILFHLLAMDEKLVRDAMSSCFKDYPMQVHDAVYSYEDVPVETLEVAVKEQAGFSVTIKKEG